MGFVMGILVWYFVGKFKDYNAKVLGSTATTLAGGTVLKAFEWKDDVGDALWWYPIGLLLATLVYWIAIIGAPDAKESFKEDED